MEIPRTLLAIAGKFPGDDYTDGRYSEPTGDLTANLGRVPILEEDGQTLGILVNPLPSTSMSPRRMV